MADDKPHVPTVLEEPGFRSWPRSIRVVAIVVGAIALILALYVCVIARPAGPLASAAVPTVAQPAVDAESTEAALATPAPSAGHARASAVMQFVTQRVPLLAASAPVAKAVAVILPTAAPAPPPLPATEVAAVPRVLTSAELTGARMNLATRATEPVAAQAPGVTAAAPLHGASGPHSAFFAEQGSDVGYDSEDAACIVRATTSISARLVTRVDSTLPSGVVKAQIVAPVNCASGAEAVPAGAILQGTFDSNTAAGEARLLVVFTRIIFAPSPQHPNGRAYEIGAQSATGAQGETGLGGRVNSGLGKALGQAALYTLLGAAGNALGNLTIHGATTIGLGGTSVTGQFVPGAQTVRPTIYANPGDPVDVVLARDLPMEPLN